MELSFPRRNQKNSMHSTATLNMFTSANSIEATFTIIIPFPVKSLNFPYTITRLDHVSPCFSVNRNPCTILKL